MAEANTSSNPEPADLFRPKPRLPDLQTAAGWAIWLIVVANAAVIIWLWWLGGGVTGVHGVGPLLTSIGRLTGLISAYQALIQVLLLARLAWLERLAGFDRLTIWHRFNGQVCLYLVLVHVVFITIGYALMDRLSVPNEVSVLLSSYPGMVTATFGTALFIIVVASSYVIARRRLRYEAWYLVHLSIYAGIALAWFHQIPTGNEFAVNRTAANYWTSLYLATLVILIVFRLGQPILHALLYRLRVAEVVVEGPDVVSVWITGRHLDRLEARAGQFFLWRFLSAGRWWESHPFSLSAAPDGRSLRITVKQLGDFTGGLAGMRPGTAVIAEGPFGVFTSASRRRQDAVMIAGGIGITPIRALLEEMSGRVTLIYRLIRDEDAIFRHELAALAAKRGVTLNYVVGDHTVPENERLLSPDHLLQLVPDLVDRDVYLCGPPGMVAAMERNVLAAGVPRQALHIERFGL